MVFSNAFSSNKTIFDSNVNFTQKKEILPLYILYSKDSFEDIGDPKVFNTGNNGDQMSLWEDSYKTLYDKENEKNHNAENEQKLLRILQSKYMEPRVDEELAIFEYFIFYFVYLFNNKFYFFFAS